MSNRTNQSTSSLGDYEHYLRSDLPIQVIISYLKAEGRDEKETDAIIEKIIEARKKVNKFMKRFVDKIERKYQDLDVPELMKKGLKFAHKHGFSKEEEKFFIDKVMTGDINKPYMPFQEMAYTEMSKFLGFSTVPLMNIKATDQAILDEIAQLYEISKGIHNAVKNNLAVYKACSPEAITGRYDRDKHNISVFIHPVVVALFLPKIQSLEKRMLISNIGRMIIQKSSQFLRKYMSQSMATTRTELEADLELIGAIARDPNSMNYFSEDSPLVNLMKRFKIQIELYKNVLSLRSGKYYSRNDYDAENDAISGLHKILHSYEWAYFDSPELYNVQDEGTFLRKLLSVFSLRPTFTQLSSILPVSTMGYSNYGASKLTFVNTPIINVRLPRNNFGVQQPAQYVKLASSLSQTEQFVENKMIIPKHKAVIHSRDLLFFYVNRRYQSINFTNLNVEINYLNVPGTMSSITDINSTDLFFEDWIKISEEIFYLRSVVILNKVSSSEFATTGCSTLVVSKRQQDGSVRPRPEYYYYNPVTANIMFHQKQANNFVTNMPITKLGANPNQQVNSPGFTELARKLGTVFVYSSKADDVHN
jgi:hypothetical protein